MYLAKKRRRKNRRKQRGCLIPILLILVIVGVFLAAGGCQAVEKVMESSVFNNGNLSKAVINYEPVIQKYADVYGISEFTPEIQAMMMQESKGKGTDPMQASESPHNTVYNQTPGGIQDPDYSIEVGVKYFAECLKAAECTSPDQTEALMLAIQGYNFGNGYIGWAEENYGGYSQENAEIFASQMAQKLGWSSYGDAQYAQRVMKYIK